MAKKICIAPGHGGFDPGAVGNGMQEKDINLAIALDLEKILTAAGVPVIMTRTTDQAAGGATNVNQDLENEVTISNNAGAELFFSIHTNSGGGKGAEIYVYPNGGANDLAKQVVDEVGAHDGLHGEPVKESSELYVLRYTKAPAMLLEVGFIDNTEDADFIRTHLHDYASWIAPALITWAGGTVEQKQTDPQQNEPQKQDDVVGQPYAASVDWAVQTGLLTRDSNGLFRPDDTVARWELAVVMQRLDRVLKG